MHIPDGFLSGQVNLATFTFSAAAIGQAARKLNRDMDAKQVPLLGVSAAFIFAVQMLNFPIAGGTSGHFLGALFAAALLGPWASVLVMTTVLLIQCLLFADGGLLALGSNVFNMGVVGGWCSFWFFVSLRKVLPKTRTGFYLSAGAGAWLSVVLASVACAAELALSGTSPWAVVFPAMTGVHAVIGLGEALITVAALSVILKVRPDLLSQHQIAKENAEVIDE